MGLKKITLITLGYFEKEILEHVAALVENELKGRVNFKREHYDLESHFDPVRKQYNGNTLLKYVESNLAYDDRITIALVAVDLYIPILTYIFGQAYLNGNSGIASLYRLGNERYGLPRDEALLYSRFAKEIIHELGHCFGLIHCHTYDCVMKVSTYVEDIDQKSTSYCSKCRQQLEQAGHL
ncbi:MAG: archaemetzincin family Zn-dependent metalloprotease [Bacteroidales bacterium]|nr:archaemetzincin family Zn-dependent metalloprotease [Bacteroidales bacterium]